MVRCCYNLEVLSNSGGKKAIIKITCCAFSKLFFLPHKMLRKMYVVHLTPSFNHETVNHIYIVDMALLSQNYSFLNMDPLKHVLQHNRMGSIHVVSCWLWITLEYLLSAKVEAEIKKQKKHG